MQFQILISKVENKNLIDRPNESTSVTRTDQDQLRKRVQISNWTVEQQLKIQEYDRNRKLQV